MADDPYLDPESGVLRNLLGHADGAVLAQDEGLFAARRELQLYGSVPFWAATTSPTSKRSTVICSATSTSGPDSCERSRSPWRDVTAAENIAASRAAVTDEGPLVALITRILVPIDGAPDLAGQLLNRR